jgi:fructose-bisphosphate aldolase class II
VSQEVVKFSHAIGVTVEAELGVLGSLETMKGDKEDGHGADGTMTREQLLTDVARPPTSSATQCDALAIAIGTSHGAYKFTRKPTGDILAIDRIKEIHARIPNTHLVMHGSSSVPQELLAIIREFGGDMKETYGVPVEEIQEGIRHGVRKINIDTDIRLAMTGAIRRSCSRTRRSSTRATTSSQPAKPPSKSCARASRRSAAKARRRRSSRSAGKNGRALQGRRAGPDCEVK